MEQFSEFERRIKIALERIASKLENASPEEASSSAANAALEQKIAELTDANEQLKSQLEELSQDDMANENARLKASLAQLELARSAETKEVQRLYEKLASALGNKNANIEGSA